MAYEYLRTFLRCLNLLLFPSFAVKGFQLPNFDTMAPSFSYPLPTIKAERLEELYTVHGDDTAVTLDLA